MGYWRSRGLRGSQLEELINLTNDKYREKDLALIQKVPTPIKPVKLDPEKGNISLAYFEQKSTVDYIGVVQGYPICFDAKETNKNYLPMQNIHEHQIQFMNDFVKQSGIAFLLVYFSLYNEYYYLSFRHLYIYWKNSIEGGRKSIPYADFDKEYLISCKGLYINYLEQIKKDAESTL